MKKTIIFVRFVNTIYFIMLKSLLIIIISLFTFLDVRAGEPVILDYADSLVGLRLGDAQYRDFMGNVQIRQGNIKMTCNHAREYEGKNRVDLTGNVRIIQDQMVLTAPYIEYDGNKYSAFAPRGVVVNDRDARLEADRGTYFTDSNIADFSGNVIIEDDSVIIYSDFVKHFRNNSDSYAYGNVVILGKNTNVVFSSDTAINIAADNYSIGYGNPLLIQIDSLITVIYDEEDIYYDEPINDVKYDTLSIKADTIQAFREGLNERYTFSQNVEIIRTSVAAKSGFADYYKTEDYFKLENNPVVWYDSTQLHSDTIFIRLDNDKIKLIELFGNSLVASRDDSLNLDAINQIIGDSIRIEFNDGDINKIYSFGNSQTLYFIPNDEGFNTVDRKNTDDVVIEFDEGEVTFIYWIGKSTAEYHPENIIFGKNKDYYLSGFKWLENRPEKHFLPEHIEKILEILKK